MSDEWLCLSKYRTNVMTGRWVIVADRSHWDIARLDFRRRLPLFRLGWEWVNNRGQRLKFEPTHWKPVYFSLPGA